MPAYWNGALHICGDNDGPKSFLLHEGLLEASPHSVSKDVYGYPGGELAVSADGNHNGVVWALETSA
jgi:hypothetical protein